MQKIFTPILWGSLLLLTFVLSPSASYGKVDTVSVDFSWTTSGNCPGDTVFFQSIVSGPYDSLFWNFGEPESGFRDTSRLDDPFHVYSSGRTFSVVLTVYADTCTTVFAQPVSVDPEPVANLGADQEICWSERITLSAANPVNDTYLWHNLSTASAVEVIEAGRYYVEVSNACGTTSDTILITHPDGMDSLGLANVFTPNGDGVNDIFTVTMPLRNTDEFLMSVYDRWGTLRFQTKNPETGWDGKEEPEGVYIYLIKGRNCRNNLQTFTGSVTLLR